MKYAPRAVAAVVTLAAGLGFTPGAFSQDHLPETRPSACPSSRAGGELAGVVRDEESDTVLAGAQVLLEGTACGALTDERGAYRITRVPPGEYVVQARMIGFEKSRAEVSVQADRLSRVDLSLRPVRVRTSHDDIVRPRPDTSLASLAWLAGCWALDRGGVSMEEHWTAPRGGLMLGLHRDVFPSGRAFFEFLRIESRPEGVFYVAQPRGRAPTQFQLVESGGVGGLRAVFVNPEHDFPQRILYWLDDAGALHARIEGEQEGKPRSSEWIWPPAPCGPR